MLTAASSNPNSDRYSVANVIAQIDLDKLSVTARDAAVSATSQCVASKSKKRTRTVMQCNAFDPTPSHASPASPGSPPGSPPPSAPELDSSASSSSSTPTIVGALDPGFTAEEAMLFERFSAARRATLNRERENSNRGFDRHNSDRHH